MQGMIVEIMNRFGYLGILVLIAVENLFPPIPSEVILTFGGFLTTYTRLRVAGVVAAATVGSLAGALVLYRVGTMLSPDRLAGLLETKALRRLGFQAEDAWKTVAWFQRYGQKAVLFGRCVPIVRSLVSVPAGMAGTPMALFVFYTVLGSVVWNVILVSLGALLGASWENILRVLDAYSGVVLTVLIAAVLLWAAGRMRRRKQRHRGEEH